MNKWLKGKIKTDTQCFLELKAGPFRSVLLGDFRVIVVDHIRGQGSGEPVVDRHDQLNVPGDVYVLGIFQVIGVKTQTREDGHVFQEFIPRFHPEIGAEFREKVFPGAYAELSFVRKYFTGDKRTPPGCRCQRSGKPWPDGPGKAGSE